MDQAIEAYLAEFPVQPETRAFLANVHTAFIDGAFLSSGQFEAREIIDPCTEGVLALYEQPSAQQMDHAIAAARRALSDAAWGGLSPEARESLLRRLADLVERDAQILAELETLNTGKALGPCLQIDILSSVSLLRYMAGWPTKIEGATRGVSIPGQVVWTRKVPVGVVGSIVPWNWPFSMAIWKLAAPLAAGCSIVLKPSELTPLSMLYFGRLCQEAGLPGGVVNIIPGTGHDLGRHLTAHPGIDKVSFTGSTAVGRQVGAAAGNALSSVTLELGGKSPMIVFPDADIKALVDCVQNSIYFNAGQVCSAGSRIYIQREIFNEVVAAIKERAESLTLAPGLDPACDMGPVISRKQQNSVLDWVSRGTAAGARLVTGGVAPDRPGFFLAPTLLTSETNALDIVQEEIFGPVLVALPFEGKEDALRLANDSPFGLGASIWTQDISRALMLAEQLQSGTVWLNTHDLVDAAFPFGGVKASGFGRDLGPEQLMAYLSTKTVWVALQDDRK